MRLAKVFNNGRSQAVRLPKEYRFATKEVVVNRVGDAIIMYPRGKGWDVLAHALEGFTPDFMAERNQPRKADRRKKL